MYFIIFTCAWSIPTGFLVIAASIIHMPIAYYNGIRTSSFLLILVIHRSQGGRTQRSSTVLHWCANPLVLQEARICHPKISHSGI